MQPQYPSIKDKYIHPGTSQLERLIAALSPGYFKMDDRSMKDILAATHQYAQLLHFYNDQNRQQGDWATFWEVETLTFLAILSSIDTDFIGEKFARIEREAKEGQEPIKKGYLKAIVFLQEQAQKINHYYLTLPDGLPFKREIFNLIKQDDDTDSDQLATALRTLISYHKEAYQEANPGESLSHEVYNDSNPENLSKDFFGDLWGIKDANAFYAISPSNQYRMDDWENLRQLAKTFQQAAMRIKQRANYWFDKNITTPQLRQPHVALYLAFLRLFEYARQEMNNLTGRHLDFFYERILHLRRHNAEPDDVHLLFQLANNVSQYLVKQGTTLLAGKLNGKNLLFETIEDWVFNKAQVAEIKNTYLDLRGTLAKPPQIYASPDVRKVYKAQAEAPNESSTAWRSMGDDVGLPYGEVGFAIASSHLILQEGIRIIDVYFNFNFLQDLTNEEANKYTKLLNSYIKISLSSDKTWLEDLMFIDKITFDAINLLPEKLPNRDIRGFKFKVDGKSIRLKILLFENDIPVVALGKKLQEIYKYETIYPILKIAINPNIGDTIELYKALRAFSLRSVRIEVTVFDIQENLIVENDSGVFFGQKELYPFTADPKVDKNFRVSAPEAFAKRLSSYALNFDWANNPKEGFSKYYENYTIGFTPPKGEITTFKDGAFQTISKKTIVFVVDDKLNMRKGDAIIVNVLKEVGYQVYVASEFESIKSYQNKDLILITSNVDAKLVPDLSSLPVPIICWEPNLYDNLGMTPLEKPQERGKESATNVNVVFYNEKLTYTNIDTNKINYLDRIPWGKVNNQAIIIAELVGDGHEKKPIFFYYPKDVVLLNNKKAPAIRMGFFFWDNSGEQLEKDAVLRQLFLDTVEFVIHNGQKKEGSSNNPEINKTDVALIKDNFFNPTTEEIFVDFLDEDFKDYNDIVQGRIQPRGFANIALTGHDFLHDEYPRILAALTLEQAKAIGTIDGDEKKTGTIDANKLPKAPIAPLLKGVKLSYTAAQDINLSESNPNAAFLYITPFKGSRKVYNKNHGQKIQQIHLVEPFFSLTSDETAQIEIMKELDGIAPANLYLGIKDLTPGSNLSLLFQTQEGTEASFEDLPPRLQWSYLAKDNEWQPFTVDRVLKDTTRGLTRTGVVQLKLPFDMVKENTLLNKELHWIRIAAMEENAAQPKKTVRALPSLVDVKAQVVEARFVLEQEDTKHFIAEKPLAAGNIKRLEISDSNIKKIEQPFPTFNGRVPEVGDAFYKRVSERLQHRDRAVTVRDYERILLEKFSKVYRAKCLRHTDLLSELAPGNVLVAVIPDLRQWNLEMPIAPRFSRGDLNEMADYLCTKTNLFVARQTDTDGPYLHVENPIYEPIAVELEVKFNAGVDEEYAKLELNKAIKGFIARWIYDANQDIAFDRALDRSRLIQFIEMQSSVDAILEITIKHCGEPTNAPIIVPFTSRSVLTTEKEHTITPKQKIKC